MLTLEEITARIAPVAKKYNLKAVYVFGSYARGDATESSDVDIVVDLSGSIVKGMMMGSLYDDLRSSIGREIDLVTKYTLEQQSTTERIPWFVDNLKSEMVKIL